MHHWIGNLVRTYEHIRKGWASYVSIPLIVHLPHVRNFLIFSKFETFWNCPDCLRMSANVCGWPRKRTANVLESDQFSTRYGAGSSSGRHLGAAWRCHNCKPCNPCPKWTQMDSNMSQPILENYEAPSQPSTRAAAPVKVPTHLHSKGKLHWGS